MPELPEVETIRRALQAHLPGRRVQRIRVRDARLRWPVDAVKLRALVVGHPVTAVNRRAKYLLLHLNRHATLILHLGMSGRLLLVRKRAPFHKHDHVVFYLDDGSQLRLRDPRRFGMVDAVPGDDVFNHPRLAHLGLEPLERSTTSARLYHQANRLQRPIKNLLMDAHFIVGVGNIYANEALFYAGLHPFTPANRLTPEHWQTLLRQIRRVLRKAIQKGGTTLNDFVNSNGETGYFQLSLAVYGRAGDPCPKCGTEIEKVVQVGRSTFYCPVCQPLSAG